MSRNIITGLDAGSSTIRIAVAEKKNGGLHILNVHEEPSDGIKNGYIVNLEDAAKSIKKAVKKAEKSIGVPVKRITLAVGGISLSSAKSKGTIMISKADGEVADYDVKRVIGQSETNLPNILNKQIIQTIPLYFKVDNNVVMGKPAGMKGAKLETETVSITCLSQHLSDLVKTVEAANLIVEDVVAAPLARSYSVLSKRQKEVGCALVDIGSNTVSITVFENGAPISLESFPIGSSHITNDIALGFQVSLGEAEKLKFGFGTDVPVSKRKLSDIIEARLNDIFELVETHLKKTNRNGMLPGGIILTGGGSDLFSLEEIARASLNLPAKIGTIQENNYIKITASPTAKEKNLDDPSWSTVLGLCIMGAGEVLNEPGMTSLAGRKITKTIKRWFRTLIP